MEAKNVRLVDGDKVKLLEVYCDAKVEIANPFPVVNGKGVLIGTAVVSFTSEGFLLRLILDPHHPEVFDLEVNPEVAKTVFQAEFSNDGVLTGRVVLE